MKKRNFLILLIVLSVSLGMLDAAVLRVNNLAGTGAGYTTLQAAHDAANPGDTLMVEPGQPYGQLVLTKRLVILGPGYFMGQNPNTNAGMFSAQVDSMTFNAGAEQTLVSGLQFKDKIFINTSTITISGNLIQFNPNSSSYFLVNIAENLSQITIKKNYINNTYTSYENCITIGDYSSVIIQNNYIYGGSGDKAVISLANSNVTLLNNVISGRLYLYTGATVKNNIWYNDNLQGTFPAAGGSHNFTINGSLTNTTDQTFSAVADIFVAEGSTDGQWKLATGSAAIGTAEDGGDCGMFGGADPYILSGINQSLPRIYYLSSSGQGTATSGLQVHIKAKAAE